VRHADEQYGRTKELKCRCGEPKVAIKGMEPLLLCPLCDRAVLSLVPKARP
jgi:hypothetical protein